MGPIRNLTFLSEILKKRDQIGDIGIDGEVMLK
jgi:hypothetical protein